MLNAKGYSIVVEPDRPAMERDTVTCCHCGAVVFVKPGTGCTVYLVPTLAPGLFREAAGAACRNCMKPVCLACEAKGTCTPLERWLEQQEKAGRIKLVRA